MDELLCPETVGRTGELAALTAAVEEAAGGTGTGTVVFGEAGSGKSRLFAEVREQAVRRGLRVLRGRVLEGGAGAFGPFPEVVASALRTLDGHDPALRTVTPVLRRVAGTDLAVDGPLPPAALAEALLRLLAVAARHRGALLLVEDVHWADEDTLRVLDYLVANADDHGGACMVSLRPQPGTEAHRVAGRLADARLARRVDLAPLPDCDVDRMVRACLRVDAVATGLLEFVRERADGIPFFVEELLAGLARLGALVRADNGWQVVERRLRAVVPPTVAESVTDRFEALHPRTRDVLRAAALLGREFEWELLAPVTDLDAPTVLASLREATYAGFLDGGEYGDGDGMRFRHALGREHIATLMLAPERVSMARRARAAVTARHPGLPGRWAQEAARLAELGGERAEAARLWMLDAAAHRDRGTLGSAAARWERALELADPDGQDALAIREDLAEVRALAGDVDAALALGAAALTQRRARADAPDRVLRLELALGRALLVAGRYPQARTYVERAARLDLAAARASAAVLHAQIEITAGEPASACAQARAALEDPELPPEACCEAREVLGRAARLADLAAAEREFTCALDLARRHGLGSWEARALAELGTLDLLDSMHTDRLEEARRAAIETGSPATEAVVDFHIGEALVARGRTADGRAAAQRAVRLARRVGSSILAPALLTVARSHAHDRNVDAMEDALAQAVAAAPDDPGVRAGSWGRVRAMLALHEGDAAGALAALDNAVELLRAVPGHHFPHWGLWALLHAVAEEDATGETAREAAAAPGAATRFNRALLSLTQAVRAGGMDPATATAAYRAGLADLCGYVDADWLVHLVGWLVAPSAHRDGWGEPIGALQSAVRWFADHDRPALATACRTRLRELGGQVPRRGRGRSSVPEALAASGVSSREVDVLRLLGRELSNRGIAEALVLSPRTVEKHVASLLRKTGATDRHALIRLGAAITGREPR